MVSSKKRSEKYVNCDQNETDHRIIWGQWQPWKRWCWWTWWLFSLVLAMKVLAMIKMTMISSCHTWSVGRGPVAPCHASHNVPQNLYRSSTNVHKYFTDLEQTCKLVLQNFHKICNEFCSEIFCSKCVTNHKERNNILTAQAPPAKHSSRAYHLCTVDVKYTFLKN